MPQQANLRGAAADDGLPNRAVSLRWSSVSGPGKVSFASTSSAATTASFERPGAYVLRLSASDGELSAYDETSVTVEAAPPVNQAPVVSAGADRSIELPNSASLAGSVSDDGLPGSGTVVRWRAISGPGNVSFSNSNAPATNANFSSEGTYTLRLTANNGQRSAYDDVRVVVAAAQPVNQAPVVRAGSNQSITLPGGANLNGAVSDDGLPGGSTSLRWSLASGPAAVSFSSSNSASTTVAFSREGTYRLRLTANDGELSSYDDVTIAVAAEQLNEAPEVNAGADQSIRLPNVANLRATVSDDGLPGGTATLRWSVSSGPGTVRFGNAWTAATTADFSANGTYVLRLTANDGELSSSDELTVVVSEAPELTLALSASELEVDLNGAVELSWTSEHADGCQASGDWNGNQASSGTHALNLAEASTFVLTCYAGGSNITRMVSVLVRNIELNWQPPTENEDGTAADDLAGYRIYSVVNGQYQLEEEVASAATTSARLARPSGEYVLAMTALDLEGNESGYSNAVRKVSP